jgi:hypothetical protein
MIWALYKGIYILFVGGIPSETENGVDFYRIERVFGGWQL